MFGTIVYESANLNYVEYLLTESDGTSVTACVESGIVKLYRVAWTSEAGDTRHKACYSLLDAIGIFQAKAGHVALVA